MLFLHNLDVIICSQMAFADAFNSYKPEASFYGWPEGATQGHSGYGIDRATELENYKGAYETGKSIGTNIGGAAISSSLEYQQSGDILRAGLKGGLHLAGAGAFAEVGDVATKLAKQAFPENKYWNNFIQYGPLGLIKAAVYD